MANYVGAKLSRLIRERSYAGGELKRLDRSMEALMPVLAPLLAERNVLKRRRRKVMAKLVELDAAIKSQSAIEPEDILARQLTPRKLGTRHGTFNAELVTFLRQAQIPLMSEQIIAHMAQVFNLPRSTPKERDDTRRRVTRRLREFVDKGAVIRLHYPGANTAGLWQWVGDYAGDGPDA